MIVGLPKRKPQLCWLWTLPSTSEKAVHITAVGDAFGVENIYVVFSYRLFEWDPGLICVRSRYFPTCSDTAVCLGRSAPTDPRKIAYLLALDVPVP